MFDDKIKNVSYLQTQSTNLVILQIVYKQLSTILNHHLNKK